ncbi:MAG: sulfatase-like hydrolase/transferase [bacterium]|nr:sulfatase-like hydrolase/transferase [bacterium]
MNNETPSEESVPPQRGSRSRWQLALGICLVLAAVGHHFWKSYKPVGLTALAVPRQEIRIPEGLTRAEQFPAEPGALKGCNLLLVTIDTLRADRVGCYGNTAVETPTLDRLAREGVLFSHALATSPTTLASHASILTGLYPVHHRARTNGFYHLDEEFSTLAEVLSERGYATGAVLSAFVLNRRFGLSQGFDDYDDNLDDEADPEASRFQERPADRTTVQAVAWMEAHSADPFFLWVHYFDPHASYAPPQTYLERYADNPYDGEIAFVDAQLGHLMETVEKLGVTERTLVVVVGDHGEGLGDHDELAHGYLLYDATLRVPLLMHCGQRLGGGVHLPGWASQVDVMPTALALLDVEAPQGIDGADLTRASFGEPRPVFFETYHGLLQHGWAALFGVVEGDRKYIHGPDPELYDLAGDPFELRNLATAQPEVAGELREVLGRMFGAEIENAALGAPTIRLSAADRAKLAGLGYAGDAGLSKGPVEREDPKRMVPLLNRCEMALLLSALGEIERTIELLVEVADEYPDFFPVYRYLGLSYQRTGEMAKADEAFSRGLELHPESIGMRYALSTVKMMRGDFRSAGQLLEGIVEDSPAHFEARFGLGMLLVQQQQFSKAAEELKAAFELDPASPKCVQNMARAFTAAARADELPGILEPHLATTPQSAVLRGALAQYYVQAEDYVRAEGLLREGVTLAPDDQQAIANLAMFLAQCPSAEIRNPAEAVRLLERFCERTGYADYRAVHWLGVAYGLGRRFDEGIAMAKRAQEMATQAGDAQAAGAAEGLVKQMETARQQGAGAAVPPVQPPGPS